MFNKKYSNIIIIGKPNVGKSTLINNFINFKISIFSNKIQTTRFSIKGIEIINNYKYIYIDTPGFQLKYKNKFNLLLNKNVINSLIYSNIILFIIEFNIFNKNDNFLLKIIPQNIPCILIINKLDNKKYNLNELTFFLKKINNKYNFNYIEYISAKEKKRLFFLKNLLSKLFFLKKILSNNKYITNKNKNFLILEIIREKIFFFLKYELPYINSIFIEKIIYKFFYINIFIIILVKKKNHKMIILGKNNFFLKKIIFFSILDIKKIFPYKLINLKIWIKIKK